MIDLRRPWSALFFAEFCSKFNYSFYGNIINTWFARSHMIISISNRVGG